MHEAAPQPSAVFPELVCPECSGALARSAGQLACPGCKRSFPVIAGIPDLRLAYPDPYVSLEEDRARACELEARFHEVDAAALLAEHWRRSGKPPELAARFLAGDRAALDRSEGCFAKIERRRGRPVGRGDRVLEVGCGTAALAAVAARRGAVAVATDLSLRWLVLAKKLLAEVGIEGITLVCCGGEAPPFVPGAFDVVVAGDVIEHAGDHADFVAGCRRSLRRGGMLFLATPNRFSLGLEPHVRLWGVGFLPHGLARRYVRAVRRAPYDHVRLLSARRLRRLLAARGFRVEIVPPEIPAATQEMYRGIELRLVRAYNRLCAVAPIRRLLLVIGPFFHVFATVRE